MVRDQKDLVFSLSKDDFDWAYSTSSKAAGGQRRDKKKTRVTVIHEPSGAKGVSQDERDQLRNRRVALKRLTETAQFRAWVAAKTRGLKTEKEIEHEVEQSLADPTNIKLEVKNGKDWIETKENELT